MRIIFLLTQDLESPSGLGRYWPLAKELARLGHDLKIFALNSNYKNLTQKKYFSKGVEINYVAQMHLLKVDSLKKYYPIHQLIFISIIATIKLTWSAITTPVDVVFIGKPHPMNGIAGLICKLFRRARILLDCDDYEAEIGQFGGKWQKTIVKYFENLLPHKADIITTNTYFNKDRLKNINIPENKIVYLPNGIDLDRFHQFDPAKITQIKDKLNLGGKKVISFIGTLGIKSHPIDLLIKSFKDIVVSIPSSRLLLVGGGEDYQLLIKYVENLNLSDSVIFTGRVPPEDIPIYYKVSDISVDPVNNDYAARGRSPLKLFESWICGVPFITGDVGDRSRLIGNPPAGLVIKPGDHEALTDGIIRILSSKHLSENYVSIGYERVKDFYWEKLILELNLFN